MPQLTVVICTRNRAESLRIALNSLVAASVHLNEVSSSLDWELVVVDNGSTDHTVAVTGTFLDRLPLQMVSEPSVGLSWARNAALDFARGEWLAFTDDDALVAPDWLEAIAISIASYPEMDYFGGRSQVLWEGPQPAWASEPELPFIQGLLCHFDFGDTNQESAPDAMLPFGVNMGMRRAVLQQVGKFRTDLGPGTAARGEETEFLQRARERGFRGWYLGSVRVLHRADESRFAVGALYRHGIAKGRGLALTSPHPAPRGSMRMELKQWLAALWMAAKGKSGWMRVCIVNAGIERGLRQARPAV